MEALIKEQALAGEKITQLFSNFKKTGSSRRTRVFLESRQERLELEWNDFEKRDAQLQNYKEEKPKSSYFERNYYEQVKAMYEEYKAAIFKAQTELENPTTSKCTDQDNTLKRLIRQQTASINALDKFLTTTEEHLKEQSSAYYKQKLTSIKEQWSSITTRHMEIVAEEDTLDYSTEDVTLLENRCQSLLIQIQEHLDNKTSSSSSNGTHNVKTNLKLPKITLPIFNGNYLQWKEFHDLYLQLIHQQAMSNAEKMFYLKANLSGEAAKLIQHLQVSEENYTSAWSTLEHRYNNKRLLLAALLNKILGQAAITGESSTSVKRLHDITNECLLGISNLGVPIAEWDPLLIHLILPKLDKETHRLYEQSLTQPREPQTVKDLLTFLESRFQMLEALGTKERAEPKRQHRVVLATANDGNKCAICDQLNHPLYKCPKFLQLSITDRLKRVKLLKRCINCLRPGHQASACKSGHCTKCERYHHSLLHIIEFQPQSDTPTPKVNNRTSLSAINSQNKPSNYVFLGTAVVNVLNRTNSPIKARALLDTGSQMSFITEKLANQLKLRSKHEPLKVSGMGNNPMKLSRKVNLCLQSRVTGYSTNLEVFILNTITSRQPSQKIATQHWHIPKNIQLADKEFNQPQEVDLLIGAELYPELISVGQIRINKNGPTLQNTLLGWVVIGKARSEESSSTPFCGVLIETPTLEDLVQRFWTIEETPSTKTIEQRRLTLEEQQCEEIFISTTNRAENGRYIVKLPFANNPASLGESKDIATKRFLSLERKLYRNPEIQKQYIQFMKEYIHLNHMTEINSRAESISGPHYFLPHHCVLRPQSSSTKLRVVFDGSARTSTNISLNDVLHAGPSLQNDLFSILLRFRIPAYVFTADISKMYRQILVDNDSKKFQLILWRESRSQPIRVYHLNTVTYGTKSAPYLAIKCLQDLALNATSQYPLGATIIRRDIYMDDILTGSDDLQEACQMKTELINLLKQGQFLLRKWCANTPALLKGIAKEDCEVETTLSDQSEASVKTLGLTWLPTSDQFIIRTKWRGVIKVTKRTILADIAHIFDPLGFVSPVIILAKIFLQELWQSKLDWDAAVPMEIHTKWLHFRTELQHLNSLKIPRHVVVPSATDIQLHCFSDASQRAYGAAIYIRSSNQNGEIKVQLVCSKCRVAPIKQLTIPRLELCAAKLMVQLANVVKTSLPLEIHKTTFWTDSQIVLAWINTQSPLQAFVANRISFINEETKKGQWKYINTEINPADLLSRGVFPDQFLKTLSWFEGPTFLYRSQSTWPVQSSLTKSEHLPEVKAIKTVLVATSKKIHFLEEINHRSSFATLRRITAYIVRFISNLKRAKAYRIKGTVISVPELKTANIVIAKYIQETTFSDDIKALKRFGQVPEKSRLSTLSPFIDNRGVVRVGGRLEASKLPYDAKHSSHLFTKLLMTHLHYTNLHAAPQALLAFARQDYWIVRGKQLAQTIVHNCIRCFKAKPRNIEQFMGNLPPERVQPSRPFTNVGVDFLGPVYIHYKIRGKQPTKAYVSVFVCFATKAVHLELVSDLTTQSFIGALKRFVARRGLPAKIFSDNATNFMGARNELNELHAKIYDEEAHNTISAHCTEKGIEWKPIPPQSPHFGGLWEAAVKSAKYHMKRIFSGTTLTQEELSTALAQIEAVLNSRPLTPMSSNPNDLEAITPGHFLTGAPLTAINDPDSKLINLSTASRWNLVTSIHREFWRRWSKEYLQEIQNRYKWKHPQEDVKPESLVLIKDDNLPPLRWRMGRVLQTIPGQDKLTRVVDIKTSNGVIRRSIFKICPLPSEAQQTPTLAEPLKLPSRSAKRKCFSSPQPKRKIKINPISSLMIGLLIIGIAFGQAATQRLVEVEKFTNNPGMYFEDLGKVNLITNEWNLFVYFNMSTYWNEYQGLKEGIQGLRKKCEMLRQNPNNFCQAVVKQLEHQLLETERLNEILKHRNGIAIRRKRSPFDIIGTIANKLFGILDQDYAQYIEDTIEEVNRNEEHLLQLNKNQTSIVESTVNVLNKSMSSIKEQFVLVNKQLTKVYQSVNELNYATIEAETFNYIAIYISQIMGSFQRTQLAILETITDTHQGRISSLLLSPRQLLKEIDNIHKHIPPTLTLPGYDEHNLPKLYELLRVKTRVTTSAIVFLVKLPLLSGQVFQIFKLIPLPVQHSDSFIFIQPSTAFLAISPYRDQYFPLSHDEYKECLQTDDDKYLCKQRHPIFNTHSTEHQCEIYLLNHEKQLSARCLLKTSRPGKMWIQLHNPNYWIFAFKEEEVLSIVCGANLSNTKLNGVGLLKLASNCVIKQPTMTINAHNFYLTNSTSSFVPALNLTQLLRSHIPEISHETSETKDFLIRGDEDLVSIRKEIADLKPKQILSKPITHHDVHQYSVSYLSLFAVFILIIIFVIQQKSSRKQRCPNQEMVFELQDLKAGEDV